MLLKFLLYRGIIVKIEVKYFLNNPYNFNLRNIYLGRRVVDYAADCLINGKDERVKYRHIRGRVEKIITSKFCLIPRQSILSRIYRSAWPL